MQPKTFIVQNHEYQSSMFKGFEEMRKCTRFFDVSIACNDSNGRILNGHKVILSSASGVFRGILSQPLFLNQSSVIVYLHSVSHKILSWLLDFIYTGCVSVPESYLDSFIRLSTELQILGIAVEEIRDATDTNSNITNNQPSLLRDNSQESLAASSSILANNSFLEEQINATKSKAVKNSKIKRVAKISTTKNSFRVHSDTENENSNSHLNITENYNTVKKLSQNPNNIVDANDCSNTLIDLTNHSNTIVNDKSAFFENSNHTSLLDVKKETNKEMSKYNITRRCKSPNFHGFDEEGIAFNSGNRSKKLCRGRNSIQRNNPIKTIILDDIKIWNEIGCLGSINEGHKIQNGDKKLENGSSDTNSLKERKSTQVKPGMCEVKVEKNDLL